MTACAQGGFAITDIAVDRSEGGDGQSLVRVSLEIQGTTHVAGLAAKLGDLTGVREVRAGDINEMFA